MRPATAPLTGLAGGVFLILFDLRVGGFDIAPDIAGWILVSVMVARLETRYPHLRSARIAANVGAACSLLDVYRSPNGTDSFVLGVVVPAGYTLVTAIAFILLCRGLSAAARTARDEPGEFRFRSLAVVNGLLAFLALIFQSLLVEVLRDKPDGYVLGGGMQVMSLILAVLEFLVAIWLVVSLINARGRPWAGVGTTESADDVS